MLSNPKILASSVLAIHGSSVLGRKNLTLDDELYTRSDVQEMFHIKPGKLDAQIGSNEIPHVALGGMYHFFPAKEIDVLLRQSRDKIEVTGVPSMDTQQTIRRLYRRMTPEAIAAKLDMNEFEVYQILYGADAGIRFRKKQKEEQQESKWFEAFVRAREAQERLGKTEIEQEPIEEPEILEEEETAVIEPIPEISKRGTAISGLYSKVKKERSGRSIVFDSVVDVLAPRLGRPRMHTDETETPEAAAERRMVSEIQYLLLSGHDVDEIHVITGWGADVIDAIHSSLEKRFGGVSYPSHLDKHKKTVLLAVFAGREFREVAKEHGITSRELSLFIMANKPSWPEKFVPNPGGISGLGVLAIGVGLFATWYFLRNRQG